MKKQILTLFIIALFNTCYAQITRYFDRVEWQNAVSNLCLTEDFESFTEDTEFRTSPLQLNGFTLHENSTANLNFGNYVDVFPYVYPWGNGNYANFFIDSDSKIEVVLEFDNPVYGFFADYFGEADGEVLSQIYNMDDNMIDSYTFTMSNTSTGITSTEPITSIRFVGTNPNQNPTGGEIFGMDNIEIDCGTPIPTLSQWSLIVLLMIILILGLVAQKNFISVSLQDK